VGRVEVERERWRREVRLAPRARLELGVRGGRDEPRLAQVPCREEAASDGADRVALVPELADAGLRALGEVVEEAVERLLSAPGRPAAHVLGDARRHLEGEDVHGE
jgi:hypothetical protein